MKAFHKHTISRRIISTFLLVMLLASAMCVSASAANTTDKEYYNSYISAGTWHTTNAYYKENSSKVYVYPKTSPTYYTRVQTWCYDKTTGNASNKTGASTVYLPKNTKCVITNYVYENGQYTTGYGVLMWLKMTPNSGTGSLYGYWSPDWSGSGSVSYF